MMMPSLSVVQTVPSRRRNDAPALSSPPNPERAGEQAIHEPLEAHRNFHQLRPRLAGHAIDQAARNHGFPYPGRSAQPVRCLNRYQMATAK